MELFIWYHWKNQKVPDLQPEELLLAFLGSPTHLDKGPTQRCFKKWLQLRGTGQSAVASVQLLGRLTGLISTWSFSFFGQRRALEQI